MLVALPSISWSQLGCQEFASPRRERGRVGGNARTDISPFRRALVSELAQTEQMFHARRDTLIGERSLASTARRLLTSRRLAIVPGSLPAASHGPLPRVVAVLSLGMSILCRAAFGTARRAGRR